MDTEKPADTPVDSHVPDVARTPLGGIPEAVSGHVLDRVMPSRQRRRRPSFQSAL